MTHIYNKKQRNEDRYKVVPNSNRWKAYKNARLQISVPTNPVYDEKFRQLVFWAVSSFDQVTLCLHDSIQRYNFIALGEQEEDAYKRSIQNGEKWLSQNIFPSDVLLDVVRWDDIRSREDFESIHDKVKQVYEESEDFRQAINVDVSTFSKRCRKRGELFDKKRAEMCVHLLVEEIAGYVVLNRETSAADIHPGMRLKALPLLGAETFDMKDNLMTAVRIFDREQCAKMKKAA